MPTSAPDPVLEMRDFAGTGDPSHLLPGTTRQNAPHFAGLAEGRLLLQRCAACAAARYPVAPVCPRCGTRDFAWAALDGSGTLHSWIRYHRGYLAEWEPLMPYVVACVQLDDGPRMFGRLDGGHADPRIGDRVRAFIERFPTSGHAVAFTRHGG